MSGQTGFAGALLDPARAVPPGLTGFGGMQAGKRFDVYRNNVVGGLIDALEAGFPVVHALVGPDFFKAMAGEFVRRHPPQSPRLMLYGADLPEFLTNFPPVQSLPYLPDIARLEYGLRESYHAADADPVDPQTLAAVPPDRLPDLRLRFVPSMRVIRSDWPIADIWRAHHGGPHPKPGAQESLIARPGYDPLPHDLPPGGFAVISALQTGEPLGAAAAPVDDTTLQTVLSVLLATGVVAGFELSRIP
ncbi:hypothetical protein RGUI_1168 [Rhodovulum sp. P5]|uniref:HvfC/BufC N-terminal domain-containing protein n=1 Tax=Rhodovulum sp. P5 TaxID=1564506 RepID=UPI0009C3C822|nr:DNA-binding domain-containing protein [Rhodovulum sp. P5]ARE39309.1 hypothetical protein RGUI_1168 [Rhodovulum sp. P5]